VRAITRIKHKEQTMSNDNIEDAKSAELAFWRAYAEMQAEISDVTKGHENMAFRSNGRPSMYANLADVLAACRPIWTKHGFAIVQNCRSVYYDTPLRMTVAVDTIVTHKSGHKEVFSGLEVLVSNINAHGIASAVTYGRRISLMPILGITGADDDDDGNSATGTPAFTQRKSEPVAQVKKARPDRPGVRQPVTAMSNDEVREEFESYAFSDEDMRVMREAGITSQRVAIGHRRQYESNAEFIAAVKGEA
jgi:hypothetical protein